ncbi:retrovirus-related pol polyprotein from transposon TNT 1-94 [Tanacetum coccineum]
MLAPKGLTFNGRPTFENLMYLKKAEYEKPCLYEIPYDQSDPAKRLVPDREVTLTLEKESRSKLNKDLVKPYDYTKLSSLYEIFKPASQEYNEQLAQANEVRKKMRRKSFVKFKPNIFKNIGFLPVSKSISKTRIAYNVMTNNINHFRELVDQAWEKHSHNHFRAPTALNMEVLIKTCLMPLAIKTQNDSFTFVHELKQEMHADLKYVESLENEIDKLESDKAEFSNMYDMLLQECVSIDVMCSYLLSLSDLDAHTELQCLYLHKVKECECLAQKISKQTGFVKSSSLVISVRTDRGTEFLNKTLHAFFKEEGIDHQTFTPRTPKHNGVVERQNHTLVEAARTMLSASKLPLFDEIKEMTKTSVANAETTVPSQQELDLLYGNLYDEFFTAGISSVNNSSSPTDNSKQQDTPPTTNIQSSIEPTNPTNVNDEENKDNQAEDTQF